MSNGHILTDPDILVVVNSQDELDQLCWWSEQNNILPPYLGHKEVFPMACNPSQGTWTHRLNKNVEYFDFRSFIDAIR